MNILQINTADIKGGAGRVAYSLQNGLKKLGHQSSLLVSRQYAQNDPEVKLIRPDYHWRRRILKKLTYYLANDLDFFPAGHILKMPEFKKADIVHCHNLHTNYFNLSALQKISSLKPTVWTFHDMWPLTAHCAHAFDGSIKENGFFACPSLDIYPPLAWHNEKYLENKKAKIYTRSSFRIVTPSQWLAKKVKQSLLKDKPLTVIYNGVDTAIFKPQNQRECRRALDLPQDKHLVLVMAKRGQSNPWKGGNYAQETIQTFKNDPDVFFVDLGGDINQSANKVKRVSFVENQPLLAKYYSAADALLYPSIADNCPLVVLEALACGLPVVAFATGGIPELVEHKINGYLAEYKNTADLIEGLNYLLRSSAEEKEKNHSAAINKIQKNFTEKIMVNNYLALYHSLLSTAKI